MTGLVAICLRHRQRLFVWEWPFSAASHISACCHDCAGSSGWASLPPRENFNARTIVFVREEEIPELMAYDFRGAVSVPDGEAGALTQVT